MSRASAVQALYDRIFQNDPLLLLQQSQQDYGDAILKHLLVYRPAATSTSLPLNLHKSNSMAQTLRPNLPITPPTAGLDQKYSASRRARTKIVAPKPDVENLKKLTMVSDGSRTSDRNDRSRAESSQKVPANVKGDRVRIAAIGYRVLISKLGQRFFGEDLIPMSQQADLAVPQTREPGLPMNEAQLGRTQSSEPQLADWENAIVGLVESAITGRSEIIFLPEFTLPPSRGASSLLGRLRRTCVNADIDTFVFAGSRHEERYNRGLIFSRKGVDVEQHWHHKTASARGLGENILGPFGKQLPSYQTKIRIGSNDASVVIPICYDAYDPSFFLNLVLDAAKGRRDFVPRFILVPAFNPGTDFVELLRDLSFLAHSVVIYVNGLHGDAEGFICGVRISDLTDRLGTLLQSIDDQYDAIDQELLDESRDFNKKQAMDARHVRTGEEQAEVEGNIARREALDDLRSELRRLQSEGRLTGLITVQDCPYCDNASHQLRDRLCYRDIQYFNIDRKLMIALLGFRRRYFENDSFLPTPFRQKSLKEATKAI